MKKINSCYNNYVKKAHYFSGGSTSRNYVDSIKKGVMVYLKKGKKLSEYTILRDRTACIVRKVSKDGTVELTPCGWKMSGRGTRFKTNIDDVEIMPFKSGDKVYIDEYDNVPNSRKMKIVKTKNIGIIQEFWNDFVFVIPVLENGEKPYYNIQTNIKLLRKVE